MKLILAFALLAILPFSASSQAAPPGSALTLAQARQTMDKALGKENFRATLETSALSLTPADAVSLCLEFAPKAPQAQKSAVVDFSGALALVAGRIQEAAKLYALTASANPAHALAASRCLIATGDSQGARSLLNSMPAGLSPEFSGMRKILLAWSDFSEGNLQAAYKAAKNIWENEKDKATRRESLYILWITAASPDFPSFSGISPGLSADQVASILSKDFPDSLERGLVEKKLSLAPATWLLWGMYPDPDALEALQGEQIEATGTSSSVANNGPAKLQAGWFSRKENAQSLLTNLRAKGFSAEIEEEKTSSGEARWAVIVQAKGDWTETQAKLKDLGFESYLVP